MEQVAALKVGVGDDKHPFAYFHNGIFIRFDSFEQLGEITSAFQGLLIENGYLPSSEIGAEGRRTEVSVVLGRDVVTLNVADDYTGLVSTADLRAAEVAQLIDELEKAEIAQFGDPLENALSCAEAIQEMGVADMPAQLVPEFVEDFTTDVIEPLHESRDRRAKHGALNGATAKDFEKKDN